MVGGLLCCRSYFTYSIVLLLGVCHHYVEVSSVKRVIHKKVGETVELSSGLPTEGVTAAKWKYGEIIAADKDVGISKSSPFINRSDINLNNFSLTVRKLTLQDSGDFIFISEINNKQSPSVTITLQVHEPITEQPVLTINSTWVASNKSCIVLLECRATGNVTYNWTIGNKTLTGPRHQYVTREQDGDTKFTCTVSNAVSEKSAFEIMTCSNNTVHKKETGTSFIIILGAAGGCLMLIIIVSVAVGVCCCKKRHAGSDTNDLTVYADIGDVTNEDGKPCSLYETIDSRINVVALGPQTVYDKIQLNRVRKASVSPYQEVS